ncbi:hypothetical protein HDE_11786 [Halotydeus destructor]|nr:hypothetical protein HDE_11786 [Halotydeus destructor]
MRFGGYAVGSLLIGLLYKYTNPLLVNSVALIVSGIVTASTGWTTTYGWLLALTLTNGFFSGMVDNVNNVFCLHLWGKENQPFMQSIHFMFGVGGLVSPLIVSPFLAPRPDLSTYSNATAPVDESLVCSLIDVDLRWPYVMVAVYTELVALYTMCLFLFYRENTPHPSRLEENTGKNASSKINMSVRNLIWVLVAAFTHIVLGMETAISNVLTSFAVMSDLRLTKVTGAYITSAYWFAFTFFRIAAVVYINYVGPFCNLIFELSLIAAANVFLMPWANSVEWCLWVGAISLDLAYLPFSPPCLAFLRNIFRSTLVWHLVLL